MTAAKFEITKSTLTEFEVKSYLTSLLIVGVDFGLYFGSLSAVAYFDSIPIKIVFSMFLGFVSSLLFVVFFSW